MPKKHRLTHADFASLRRPRRESGRFLMLTYTESLGNKPKFACVVSKKIAPKATDRNTIRRRVMAALRELPFDTFTGTYVFTARKEAKDADFEDFQADVRKMVSKIAH